MMTQKLDSNNQIFGYVTSRPFGPFVMPVPAQNSCLREYALQRSLQYVPPQLEHKYSNCFMQLYGTIRRMPLDSKIVMYSVEILLEADSLKLQKILNKFFDKKIELNFVLENVIVKNQIEFDSLSLRYKIKKLKFGAGC